MARPTGRILGPILIFAGFLLLIARPSATDFWRFWPLLLVAVGTWQLWRRQDDEDRGLLFSGVLLLLLGVYFQLAMWDVLDFGESWPVFLLAPGLAFLVVALSSEEHRVALVPGAILIGLAIIFWLPVIDMVGGLLRIVIRIGVPVALIVLGGWLTFGRRRALGGGEPGIPDKISPMSAAPLGSPGPVEGRGGDSEVAEAEDVTAHTAEGVGGSQPPREDPRPSSSEPDPGEEAPRRDPDSTGGTTVS